VLATFAGPEAGRKADWTHLVEWRAGAPPGYALIRYTSPSVEVVGLVAASEAQRTAARIQGWSHSSRGFSGAMSHTRRAFLRAGAKLYAPGTQGPAGDETTLVQVGTADGNFSVHVEPRPVGGFSLVHVFILPFGNLDALVRPSALTDEDISL
jgi:hypothetical protein